jgi:RNA polymerase sigma-70 factor (sigma-E family)
MSVVKGSHVRSEAEVEAFCDRMLPRLVGALSLYCGDRDLANELAQETLARCWVAWSSGRLAGVHSPEAWAHRVAMNLASSWYRRRAAERRARRRLPHIVEPEAPDVASILVVRGALRRLPTRQRQAVVLRYFADLSVQDAAHVMGCAAGTVKALTSQAMATLRQDLALEGVRDGR